MRTFSSRISLNSKLPSVDASSIGPSGNNSFGVPVVSFLRRFFLGVIFECHYFDDYINGMNGTRTIASTAVELDAVLAISPALAL